MSSWTIWNPISLTGIFHLSYYFDDNLTLTFLGWGYWIVVLFLLACIVGAFVIPRKTKNFSYLPRQIWLKIGQVANLTGWLGLIWLFFRYEGIRYLSWRLWPAILIIYILVEVGLMIKLAKYDFPKKRASKITGQEKEKYLKRYLRK